MVLFTFRVAVRVALEFTSHAPCNRRSKSQVTYGRSYFIFFCSFNFLFLTGDVDRSEHMKISSSLFLAFKVLFVCLCFCDTRLRSMANGIKL